MGLAKAHEASSIISGGHAPLAHVSPATEVRCGSTLLISTRDTPTPAADRSAFITMGSFSTGEKLRECEIERSHISHQTPL